MSRGRRLRGRLSGPLAAVYDIMWPSMRQKIVTASWLMALVVALSAILVLQRGNCKVRRTNGQLSRLTKYLLGSLSYE